MKKKDLILKWLDHEPLSESESKAFNKLDASDSFSKISRTAKHFSAPDFSVDENLEMILSKLKDHKIKDNHKIDLKPWLIRVAAVFVLGFGIYFSFFFSQQTIVTTIASEKTTVELPDRSTVVINASSKIAYNAKNWKSKREIELQGEAFFRVAKGKKFDVVTAAGVITVLGTQFNVEARNDYFEVTCYEGLVGVTYNNKEIKLAAGNSFKLINGVVVKDNVVTKDPDWTHGKSTFKSTPLYFVLREFERQYNIKIVTKNIDQNIVFTGNFVHSDLQTALQSITIPMRLNYLIDNNLITLYKE